MHSIANRKNEYSEWDELQWQEKERIFEYFQNYFHFFHRFFVKNKTEGVSMFVYLLSIIKNEEIISMISNYLCQMLDMGRQQLPILKMGKNKNNKIK